MMLIFIMNDIMRWDSQTPDHDQQAGHLGIYTFYNGDQPNNQISLPPQHAHIPPSNSEIPIFKKKKKKTLPQCKEISGSQKLHLHLHKESDNIESQTWKSDAQSLQFLGKIASRRKPLNSPYCKSKVYRYNPSSRDSNHMSNENLRSHIIQQKKRQNTERCKTMFDEVNEELQQKKMQTQLLINLSSNEPQEPLAHLTREAPKKSHLLNLQRSNSPLLSKIEQKLSIHKLPELKNSQKVQQKLVVHNIINDFTDSSRSQINNKKFKKRVREKSHMKIGQLYLLKNTQQDSNPRALTTLDMSNSIEHPLSNWSEEKKAFIRKLGFKI